jgi:CubicO group peptidase (beta-lactamase class C family)
MRRFQLTPLFLAAFALASAASAQTAYYPPRGDGWERREPAQVGLDAARVREAVEHALASEAQAPRDLLANHLRSFGREPHGEATGPFKERGGAAGLIIRNGYIVAEWGDTERVDVTFSVTKSFVSTVVGLAFDRGLLRDLHRPAYLDVAPIVALAGPPGMPDSGALRTVAGAAPSPFRVISLFEGEHDRKITWDHLLRQTSDWEGELWAKPDWADRPRGDLEQWKRRPRNEPGSVYTYNDVRVNVLALAALNVWRRPLPQVLKEHVMDPIGASDTWRWFGYHNSWIVLDGALVQSVSGGAHWGGGMWISARDMARFGLLTLRRGRWGERQLISEQWIRLATTPTPARPTYGFMNFFLNTDRQPLPAAPAQAFYHLGAGTNVIYVDPVHDIVIVARWITNIGALDAMIAKVLTGVTS